MLTTADWLTLFLVSLFSVYLRMFQILMSLLQALVKLGMMPEVRSCERCRDLVDEAKNFLLLPDDGSRIAPELTQPRQPLRSAVLYAVGGWCTGEALADVER